MWSSKWYSYWFCEQKPACRVGGNFFIARRDVLELSRMSGRSDCHWNFCSNRSVVLNVMIKGFVVGFAGSNVRPTSTALKMWSWWTTLCLAVAVASFIPGVAGRARQRQSQRVHFQTANCKVGASATQTAAACANLGAAVQDAPTELPSSSAHPGHVELHH